jgi:hypothetical protein
MRPVSPSDNGPSSLRRLRAGGLALAAILVAAVLVPAALARGGSTLTEVKEQQQVPWPNPKVITAVCPGKQYVNFGGFKTNGVVPIGTGPTPWIDALSPAGKNRDRWQVKVHNDTAAYEAKVTSLGYCSKDAKPTIVKTTKTIGGSKLNGLVQVACPKKTILIGGGWSSNADHTTNGEVLPRTLARSGDAQALDLLIANEKEADVKVTAIAVCGKGKAPKAYVQAGKVRAHKRKTLEADCPKKKEVVFGGFSLEYSVVEGTYANPYAFWRPGSKVSLTVGGIGTISTDEADFSVIAYCS